MEMEELMAQAQMLQNKVSSAQESLANMKVTGIAGNGLVVMNMTGKYDLISVNIKEEVLSQGTELVSKLVADAYRDAKTKADVLIDKVMSDATAGLPLPK